MPREHRATRLHESLRPAVGGSASLYFPQNCQENLAEDLKLCLAVKQPPCLLSPAIWCQSVGRRPTTLRRRGNGRAIGAVAAGSSSPARAESACQLSLTSLRHVCRSGGRSVGFSEATLGRRRRPAGFDPTENRILSTSEMGYDCRGTMVLASWTFFADSESSSPSASTSCLRRQSMTQCLPRLACRPLRAMPPQTGGQHPLACRRARSWRSLVRERSERRDFCGVGA